SLLLSPFLHSPHPTASYPLSLHDALPICLVRCRKRFLGDVLLGDDALDDAGAVADLEEVKLAAGAFAVEPAAQQDLPAILSGDVADVQPMIHEDGGYHRTLWIIPPRANSLLRSRRAAPSV